MIYSRVLLHTEGWDLGCQTFVHSRHEAIFNNNESYFWQYKISHMQCVNSVYIVMQKILLMAEKQNLIAAYSYSIHVPLVTIIVLYGMR
jgi:hypothetical protein